MERVLTSLKSMGASVIRSGLMVQRVVDAAPLATRDLKAAPNSSSLD